jgi:ABC-type transporter Mla maintaining outer membrane lipid asymmetry ATPase subunit MlaF
MIGIALELEEVTVLFGDYEVVSNSTVSFPHGQVSLIIGKAGSGKSTLLKAAAGLVVPEQGHVLFEGHDLARMSHSENMAFRKASSFVFQDSALWANQSIYNNLNLPLAVHEPGLPKSQADARIKDVVRRVGYNEGLAFRPAELSSGEQKLISFARALVLDPSLIFLDEPDASLDEEAVERVLEILKECKRAGKTIIIVSHNTRLIAELADFIFVVADGKVVSSGPADQIAQVLGGELLKRIRAVHERDAAIDPAIDAGAGGA